jgi:hypothetical protein
MHGVTFDSGLRRLEQIWVIKICTSSALSSWEVFSFKGNRKISLSHGALNLDTDPSPSAGKYGKD